MRVGDLVTVGPAKTGTYLIVEECTDDRHRLLDVVFCGRWLDTSHGKAVGRVVIEKIVFFRIQ